jgi:predicted O-methyltransferase YrrM
MARATPTNIKMAKAPATLNPMLQAKKLNKRPHKLELGAGLGTSGFFLVSVMFG